MKKIVLAILLPCFLSACVHTTPMPVQTSQPGDTMMSCQSILDEMSKMRNSVAEADSEKNGQIAKNVGLGVAGALLIVPWFFMDTSDAHTIEAKAARERYLKLHTMWRDKGCEQQMNGVKVEPLPSQLQSTQTNSSGAVLDN
ncbi:MAG: hypothetical protein ACI4NO_00400 [Oxalobacter sp.]